MYLVCSRSLVEYVVNPVTRWVREQSLDIGVAVGWSLVCLSTWTRSLREGSVSVRGVSQENCDKLTRKWVMQVAYIPPLLLSKKTVCKVLDRPNIYTATGKMATEVTQYSLNDPPYKGCQCKCPPAPHRTSPSCRRSLSGYSWSRQHRWAPPLTSWQNGSTQRSRMTGWVCGGHTRRPVGCTRRGTVRWWPMWERRGGKDGRERVV